MSVSEKPALTPDQIADLRDVHSILALLSAALCVIASPSTPIIVARATAVMAQHTAMAWADVVDDMIVDQGASV